jgi:hypothetical protein
MYTNGWLSIFSCNFCIHRYQLFILSARYAEAKWIQTAAMVKQFYTLDAPFRRVNPYFLLPPGAVALPPGPTLQLDWTESSVPMYPDESMCFTVLVICFPVILWSPSELVSIKWHCQILHMMYSSSIVHHRCQVPPALWLTSLSLSLSHVYTGLKCPYLLQKIYFTQIT